MKRNAIVRIILYSLIICMLSTFLVMGIGINLYQFVPFSSKGDEISMIQGVSGSKGSVNADEIEVIEIEWIAGFISISTDTTDQISFQETEVNYSDQMVWEQSGNTLKIKFKKKPNSIFGIKSNVKKALNITVPEKWTGKRLTINSVSAPMEISDITVCDVILDNVSGVCTFNNCIVQNAQLNTVSGTLTYSGILDFLTCSSVSAECHTSLFNTPNEIKMDGVSGNLTLELPDDCGFIAEMDTVSGSFSSEFETEHTGNSHSGTYVHGNGSCKVSMDGVSCSLYLNKQSAGVSTSSPSGSQSSAHHSETNHHTETNHHSK